MVDQQTVTRPVFTCSRARLHRVFDVPAFMTDSARVSFATCVVMVSFIDIACRYLGCSLRPFITRNTFNWINVVNRCIVFNSRAVAFYSC